MATYNVFRQASSSRYMLLTHVSGAVIEGGNVFKMYFDTFAEAKVAVKRNIGFWTSPEMAVYHQPLNGFSVANLPAEFVKAQSKRYGRCEIARRSKPGVTQTLVLIALV